MRRCFLVVAIALCFAVFGASALGQTLSGTYPVTGVVLDRVTFKPIPGVKVSANGTKTSTDSEGKFQLELPAGIASIDTLHLAYRAKSRARTHRVRVGENTPRLIFYLTPLTSITVHAVYSDGVPARGIPLVLYMASEVNGRMSWHKRFEGGTDRDGTFQISDIHGGSYALCTLPLRPNLRPASEAYSVICYPGVTEPSGAGLMRISDGQQLDLRFPVEQGSAYPVSISLAGLPTSQRVTLQIFDQNGWLEICDGQWDRPPARRIRCDLPNGRYYAEVKSYGDWFDVYGRADFEVANGRVELSPKWAVLYPITVQVQKDFIPSDGHVHKESSMVSPDGLWIGLMPERGFRELQWGVESGARNGVPGSAQIRLSAPGHYWMNVEPGQGYVSSITRDGVDLTRAPLTIILDPTGSPYNMGGPLQITLRNDGGQIEGTVDVSSIPDPESGSRLGEILSARVLAIPLSPSVTTPKQTDAELPGKFEFHDLAPGKYSIVAVASNVPFDEAVHLSAKGTIVDVTAASSVLVRVRVLPADRTMPSL